MGKNICKQAMRAKYKMFGFVGNLESIYKMSNEYYKTEMGFDNCNINFPTIMEYEIVEAVAYMNPDRKHNAVIGKRYKISSGDTIFAKPLDSTVEGNMGQVGDCDTIFKVIVKE